MSSANRYQVIQEGWGDATLDNGLYCVPPERKGKGRENRCVWRAMWSYLRRLWGHTGFPQFSGVKFWVIKTA